MTAPSTDLSSNLPTTFQLVVQLVQAFAWPTVAIVCICILYKPLLEILRILKNRLEAGASIEIYQVKVGQAPTNLPSPSSGDIITADHMALIHSSWR